MESDDNWIWNVGVNADESKVLNPTISGNNSAESSSSCKTIMHSLLHILALVGCRRFITTINGYIKIVMTMD